MSKQNIREWLDAKLGKKVLTIASIYTKDELADLIQQYTQDQSGWVSVDDYLPATGQSIILFANNVVQHETYYLDAGDSSDYHTEHFWANNHKDCTEDVYEVKSGQKWMPLPLSPTEEA